MKILIQNGHVVDPLTGVDEVCDVLAVSYTHLWRSFLLYGEGAWKTLDGSAFFRASDYLFCLWIQWSAVL